MARVLVADDDDDIRFLIELRLIRDGHDVTTVGNGRLAWEALQGGGFDLAILDNTMPELSGIEVTALCRAESAGLSGLRILMVTARVQDQDAQEGLDTGVDHYMTKPFSLADLSQQVATLVAR